MASLAGAQALFVAQTRAKRRVTEEVLQPLADRVSGIILRYAGGRDVIPPNRESDLLVEIGDAVDRQFVGPDRRNTFDREGRALSPFGRVLNEELALATFLAIVPHSQLMQQKAPLAVQDWLRRAAPVVPPGYDPIHLWVDPRGYRLNDRSWETGARTRMKLDRLLSQGVRTGTPATRMARQSEQFLLPDRAKIRTSMPYGSDGSYDAMRLARTEIAHAHGAATIAASRSNPYVTKIAWHTSARHPKMDICDDNQDNGPYAPNDVPQYPGHPFCLCYLTPEVTENPASVTERLQAQMDAGDTPTYTPIDSNRFAETLLGTILFGLIVNELKQQEAA